MVDFNGIRCILCACYEVAASYFYVTTVTGVVVSQISYSNTTSTNRRYVTEPVQTWGS